MPRQARLDAPGTLHHFNTQSSTKSGCLTNHWSCQWHFFLGHFQLEIFSISISNICNLTFHDSLSSTSLTPARLILPSIMTERQRISFEISSGCSRRESYIV